ncbi:MAG: DinB family protein [Planctomycetota bacterium]
MITLNAETLRDQVAYEGDSFAAVLDALESLEALKAAEAGGTTDGLMTKALSAAAHIVGAREVWLVRLRAEDRSVDVFPDAPPLEAVRADFARVQAEWQALASAADDMELARVVAYTSREGEPRRSSVSEICLHVYGHSMYHRGQIGALIARMGGTSPATDFIFWSQATR